MEDKNRVIPIIEYQGSHPNKTVVGHIENGIYFTTRTSEHFFRIFEGFGLSVSVHTKLVEAGVKKIVITYSGFGTKRYLLTHIKDWTNGGYYTNLILVNNELVVDPQFALAISDMKEISESELKTLNENLLS